MNNPIQMRIQTLMALPQDGMMAHMLRTQLNQLNLNRVMISMLSQAIGSPQAAMSLQNAHQQTMNNLLDSMEQIFNDYFNGQGPAALALRRLAAAGIDPDITPEKVEQLLNEKLAKVYEDVKPRVVEDYETFNVNDEIHARVNTIFGVNSQRRWNGQAIGAIFDALRQRKLAADVSDAHFAENRTMLVRVPSESDGTVYGLRLFIEGKNRNIITFAEKQEQMEIAAFIPLEEVWLPHNDMRLIGDDAAIHAALDVFLAEAGIDGFMDPVETEHAPVRADNPWSDDEAVLDVITAEGELLSLLYPKDYPLVVSEGGDLTGTRQAGELKVDDEFTMDSRHPEYAGTKARVRAIAVNEGRDERQVDTQTLLNIKLRAADGSVIEEVSALFGRLNVLNADSGLTEEVDVRDVAIGTKVRYDHDGVLRDLEVVEITPSEIYAGEEKAGVIVLKLERYGRTFHRSFSQDRIVELMDRDVSEEWAAAIIDDAKVGHFLKIDSADPVWVLDIITEDDDAQAAEQLATDAEEAESDRLDVEADENGLEVELTDRDSEDDIIGSGEDADDRDHT